MFYDPDGNPITIEQWTEEFRKDRIVDRSELEIDGREVLVSTVYLGSDHNFGLGGPPLIYETMVFIDGIEEDPVWRYSTIDDARRGHQRVVNQMRDSLGRFTLDGLAN